MRSKISKQMQLNAAVAVAWIIYAFAFLRTIDLPLLSPAGRLAFLAARLPCL